jgi:biotin transporter BioY
MEKAFVASVLPYLPGTVIKILVLVPLAKRFRPIMKNYLY